MFRFLLAKISVFMEAASYGQLSGLKGNLPSRPTKNIPMIYLLWYQSMFSTNGNRRKLYWAEWNRQQQRLLTVECLCMTSSPEHRATSHDSFFVAKHECSCKWVSWTNQLTFTTLKSSIHHFSTAPRHLSFIMGR